MATDISSLDIQFVKGVGPRRAALLRRIGIENVRDAIFHFPQRYEDRRNTRKIRDLSPGVIQTVSGRVIATELKEPGGGRSALPGVRGKRRGLTIFEVTVTDGSARIRAKWFNQPFMKDRFKQGDNVVMSGMVKDGGVWGMSMDNPDYEISDDADTALENSAAIVPVYGATEGLSPKQIRSIISGIVRAYIDHVVEPLPQELLERNGFPPYRQSVLMCHFPENSANVEALNSWHSPHQRTLAFTELFLFELGIAAIKKDIGRETGIKIASACLIENKLRAVLPFQLTGAQERALADIKRDMAAPAPMNRLMQGDVGSGKTIVAVMAMLNAVECGYQAALMAPTEILAGQHYLTLHGMIESLGLRVALLTGSSKGRPLLEIEQGEIDIVVGTHALIEEKVKFKNLGIAVIDEQHRFGVAQRARLRKKSENPDILIMTATPIPRTLALTLYGDLDYSVIRELPPGRTPIRTALITETERDRVYREIDAEVAAGGQVYVVYPLIEESETLDLKSAITGEEAMRHKFPAHEIALIHGRLKPEEREAIMARFKSGDIDILISTTVIEVGVDVPNASLMVIVHAERFGLSQLHQLRGRVGRGTRPSRCLLIAYGHLGVDACRRLNAMVATTDGFRLAEEDLDIRGPGEFMGTRQSGMPDLRVANIVRDAELLEVARRESFLMIEDDPGLDKWNTLRTSAESFWQGKIEFLKTG